MRCAKGSLRYNALCLRMAGEKKFCAEISYVSPTTDFLGKPYPASLIAVARTGGHTVLVNAVASG